MKRYKNYEIGTKQWWDALERRDRLFDVLRVLLFPVMLIVRLFRWTYEN